MRLKLRVCRGRENSERVRGESKNGWRTEEMSPKNEALTNPAAN